MTTNTLNTTDYYVEMLSALSNTEKLEVIAKLIESMKPKKKTKKITNLEMLKDFEGSWGGDLPVEEYVSSLRNSTPSKDVSW
ncbi:MAG: hypothetical protein LIP09_14865 [Bacteroidales bacterium]|nr:hypothetical protein [Bacteroidales bacterium]